MGWCLPFPLQHLLLQETFILQLGCCTLNRAPPPPHRANLPDEAPFPAFLPRCLALLHSRFLGLRLSFKPRGCRTWCRLFPISSHGDFNVKQVCLLLLKEAAVFCLPEIWQGGYPVAVLPAL